MVSVNHIERLIINKSLKKNIPSLSNLTLNYLLVLSKYVHYYKFNEILFEDPVVYRKYGPRVEYISDKINYSINIYSPVLEYEVMKMDDNLNIFIEIHSFNKVKFTRKEEYTVDYVVERFLNCSYHEMLANVALYERALGSRLSNLGVLGKVYFPERVYKNYIHPVKKYCV